MFMYVTCWPPFVQSLVSDFKRGDCTRGSEHVTEKWSDAHKVTERLRTGDEQFVAVCIESATTKQVRFGSPFAVPCMFI